MHLRVAEIVRSGWCIGLSQCSDCCVDRFHAAVDFGPVDKSIVWLCDYAPIRRILFFPLPPGCGQRMSWILCTGNQICIRLGVCSCLYAWKRYHKYLQGWSRLFPQAHGVLRTWYSHGTAKNRRRSTALNIRKIMRRLPFTVFGSPTFRPWADRWTIRYISYIINYGSPPWVCALKSDQGGERGHNSCSVVPRLGLRKN